MLFAIFSLTLAEAVESASTREVGSWFLVLACVASPIASVIIALAVARRQPPLGEEMHRTFIPREEYHADINKLHDLVTAGAHDRERMLQEMRGSFGDVERALGRIEGQLIK